jgi:hypothetical protein
MLMDAAASRLRPWARLPHNPGITDPLANPDRCIDPSASRIGATVRWRQVAKSGIDLDSDQALANRVPRDRADEYTPPSPASSFIAIPGSRPAEIRLRLPPHPKISTNIRCGSAPSPFLVRSASVQPLPRGRTSAEECSKKAPRNCGAFFVLTGLCFKRRGSWPQALMSIRLDHA